MNVNITGPKYGALTTWESYDNKRLLTKVIGEVLETLDSMHQQPTIRNFIETLNAQRGQWYYEPDYDDDRIIMRLGAWYLELRGEGVTHEEIDGHLIRLCQETGVQVAKHIFCLYIAAAITTFNHVLEWYRWNQEDTLVTTALIKGVKYEVLPSAASDDTAIHEFYRKSLLVALFIEDFNLYLIN